MGWGDPCFNQTNILLHWSSYENKSLLPVYTTIHINPTIDHHRISCGESAKFLILVKHMDRGRGPNCLCKVRGFRFVAPKVQEGGLEKSSTKKCGGGIYVTNILLNSSSTTWIRHFEWQQHIRNIRMAIKFGKIG